MRDSSLTSKERLLHIEQAISDILKFTKDETKDSFLAQPVLINATLFQFAVIGEAIKRIDNAILDRYDYPWYRVRGFRNFILHEYHSIEYSVIWEAIVNDLPELERVIKQILKEEF